MIELDQAWRHIEQSVRPLGSIDISIERAAGHVLAEIVVSPINVCPFRSSAMDGFAVRAEWLEQACSKQPVTLDIAATMFAGDALPVDPLPNGAIKIMTGAIVPDRFDSVVRFEDTTYDDKSVTFVSTVTPGTNLREAGEDVQQGQTLFSSGYRLHPVDTGILAGIGLTSVRAVAKPSLLVAGTGNEVISAGQPLRQGQVYNSNEQTICSLLSTLSSRVCRLGIAGDHVEALTKLLMREEDVLITSGGVSAGEKDLLVGAAEACGWTTVFHRVRIKPGKPVYFATRGRQLLLGLPGNPLSTAVTCALFAIPVLKKLAGRTDYFPKPKPAELASGSVRKSGRMLIWPGTIQENCSGLQAEFADKKSSSALSALLGSDGLIFQRLPVNESGQPKIEVLTWEQILN
ncbi:MAG: molybdopterin molybdotransferase MoeA [Candidatus Zixiibacteriota bacterium]